MRGVRVYCHGVCRGVRAEGIYAHVRDERGDGDRLHYGGSGNRNHASLRSLARRLFIRRLVRDGKFLGDAVEIPTTMPDRNITYYAKFTELPKAKLSLDAGEVGTLETSEFEVTVGTNVSEFLADIVPTVSGDVTFGGWFGR